MEFRETLLAAQRNQQQKSSGSYYKARFDPPKKEFKHKDKLSANIQKFLAKKDEEEKQKKLEAQRKREELLAMRDPKAMRKIQKSLKVIKSANKSVLEEAKDKDNTAVTLTGPEQPDQDDYGYESQEAAAIYAKMMQKYSKIPDAPKFPTGTQSVKKDLNGTRERVKHALQHEDEPVPHKRRRKTDNGERDSSPPTSYEPEKKKEESKPEKAKIRRPAPPPMDFNQLLKIAEQKKSEPIEVLQKKVVQETETERLMTKKQKKEYEDEMARRQRRMEAIKSGKESENNPKPRNPKEIRPVEKEKKSESGGLARIPKLSDKLSSNKRNESPKPLDRERERQQLQREKDRTRLEREKLEREKKRLDKEILDKLKSERERIDRDIERLNKDREKLEKAKIKLDIRTSDRPGRSDNGVVDRSKMNSKDHPVKKNIDLKSQNTYRIDKNANEKKSLPTKSSNGKYMNGHSSQGKLVSKSKEQIPNKNDVKDRVLPGKNNTDDRAERQFGKELPRKPDDRKLQSTAKPQASKPSITNSFDFDKHVNSLGKNGHVNKNDLKRPNGSRQFPPGDVRRKPHPDDIRKKQKKRALDSESEYDSELDDFIDDGEEDMDYSKHIKEIFGYDKSKYRDMDDDDDPSMESSFARQQREEYISKKIGIMEDLEDMRMEAMEKKKSKKSRRISDD